MINLLVLLLGVTIIGHRGSPCNAPENTLSSFKKAMEAGVPFVEFDVHLTKDGVPVVAHDPQLGRTVDVPRPLGINFLTLSDLKGYDAGVIYHSDFKGERVPTLEEVFALTENKVGMMIEIKTGTAPDPRLAEEVMRLVQRPRVGNQPILVGSFSPAVLQRVKEIDPKQPIIALAKTKEGIESHLSNNPEYFGLKYTLITPDVVSALKERKIWVWTVNDEQLRDDLVAMGVDGIITNRPMALNIK